MSSAIELSRASYSGMIQRLERENLAYKIENLAYKLVLQQILSNNQQSMENQHKLLGPPVYSTSDVSTELAKVDRRAEMNTMQTRYSIQNREQEIILFGAQSKKMHEPPLLAKIERVGEKRVRCMVDFDGFLIPVAFSRHVIDAHGLSEGRQFHWHRSGRNCVSVEDIKPIPPPSDLPIEEIRRLRELHDQGKTWEEIVNEW
jgi:hypothetical protein